MSAPPPPPPPPTSAPPAVPGSTASTWNRRASRDQRRAAALAARQQRDLVRLQLRAQRRGSLVGPLLLVATGLLFLLIELGRVRPDAVLAWMSHWWPTLLVGSGLILLAEWAADTWVGQHRQANLPRRTLGAGAVFLLVLVTIAGLLANSLTRGSAWVQKNWGADWAETWGLDQIFAQESETDQDLSAPLVAGALLTIHNYRGNIHVVGASPDGQVHVSVHQRVVAWHGDELGGRQRRKAPSLQRDGAGLRLTVEGRGRDQADLTIQVPHASGLLIAPEKGDLSIAELRGPITVEEHTGNITLTGLAGPVHLSSDDDDATINGHSLSGDLTVEGRSGDLTFTDLTGPLTLHGDFFGISHLEHIHGPVHFRSSFTDFACAGVPGELTVDGRSALDADNLDGPVLLTTTDRNVTFAGVRDGATITDRNGSVDLGLIGTMAAARVNTTDGSIQLHLPPKAAFSLTADTTSGKIDNDLGLTSIQEGDRTSLTGQISHGGPELRLQATDGDITIDHASSAGPKKRQGRDDNLSEAVRKVSPVRRQRQMFTD